MTTPSITTIIISEHRPKFGAKMKKHVTGIFFILIFLLTGCNVDKTNDKIKFVTSADYPPFEYNVNGEIKGFDIELAQLIAKTLGKDATFEDMQFSSIFTAIQNGFADAAISTITITAEHQKKLDFSDPYHTGSMAMVFLKKYPINNESQLPGKKIACQLGTTMEIWLKKHITDNKTIITMDSNNQAIEALKAGHIDGVLMEQIQAKVFVKKNPGLSYALIGKSDESYGIALKKGSPLKAKINMALKFLEDKGEIKKLKQKWLQVQ